METMTTTAPHFLTPESSIKDKHRSKFALDATLEDELNRLNTYISSVYEKMPYSQRRFIGYEQRRRRIMKQMEVLKSYELQDSETIREALRASMPNPDTFDQAVASMPPRKVITFAQLIKIRRFELAKTMADVILQKSKSTDKRKEEAQTLMALVKQLTETFHFMGNWRFRDDGMADDLICMLKDVVTTGEVPEFRPPATIDEAYLDYDWPSIKKLYEEQKDKPLSKAHLNKVILLAAWKSKWEVFLDCAQRGAELIKNLKDDTDTPKSVSNGGIVDDACDMSEDTETPKQFLINAEAEKTARRSPLHEALRIGGFKLQEVEALFPDELANATDEHGNTLLHLAVGDWNKEVLIDNVSFLMKHKADINVEDKKGRTVVECMVSRGDVQCDGNALAEIVMGADYVSPRCWRPANSWSALHVLCSQGLHQYIVPFVEKGANQFELRNKLTLIDTLALQEGLHYTVKEMMLTALLDEKLSIGPFHAGVVRERPLHEENMVYREHMTMGRDYLYPVERLLFPIVSTRWLRKAQLKLVQMLVDAGAVCSQELQALAPLLASLKEDGLPKVEEYLRTQIKNLSVSAHRPDICVPLEEIKIARKE